VRCKDAATSLRFLLRIDDPEKAPDAKLQAWLASRKSTLLHQLRVHFNEVCSSARMPRCCFYDTPQTSRRASGPFPVHYQPRKHGF